MTRHTNETNMDETDEAIERLTTATSGMMRAIPDLAPSDSLLDALDEFRETAAFGSITYVDFRGYEVDAIRHERVIGPAELPDDFEDHVDLDDLRRA